MLSWAACVGTRAQPLVAGVIQDHGEGSLRRQRREFVEQRAHAAGIDGGSVDDRDDLLGHGLERPQHVEALPPSKGL